MKEASYGIYTQQNGLKSFMTYMIVHPHWAYIMLSSIMVLSEIGLPIDCGTVPIFYYTYIWLKADTITKTFFCNLTDYESYCAAEVYGLNPLLSLGPTYFPSKQKFKGKYGQDKGLVY